MTQLMFQKIAYNNEIGNAYKSAIRMAFGEEDLYQKTLYRNKLKGSQDIPKGYVRVCKTDQAFDNSLRERGLDIGSDPIQRCSWQPPHVERYDLYDNHCASWRYEECGTIWLDAKYLKDKMLHKKVMQIINNPCEYYPSKQTLLAEKAQIDLELTVFDDQGKRQWHKVPAELNNRLSMVIAYLRNADYLGCSAESSLGTQRNTKLIIGFEDDNGKNVIIQHVKFYVTNRK
jgi:hypothetical protein